MNTHDQHEKLAKAMHAAFRKELNKSVIFNYAPPYSKLSSVAKSCWLQAAKAAYQAINKSNSKE
jgi:hypothetical protein